ncbi:hypothetical protein CCACVL1_00543 [Corchorus capsularis]|uniref:Uncharacterized protein n=1 Tax=Corchorus capsularis TaxID=210143 RepID=A0A1R3KW90_COCAP|nr:hypothetical protein CCACVL1_00543 [Corchorus capsularis]
MYVAIVIGNNSSVNRKVKEKIRDKETEKETKRASAKLTSSWRDTAKASTENDP